MPSPESIDHRCPDCGVTCWCPEGSYDPGECVHACAYPEMKVKIERTGRGFQAIRVPASHPEHQDLVVRQSSSSMMTGIAGRSHLWIGGSEDGRAHLDREAVKSLVNRLRHWLDTGSLFMPGEEPPDAEA